MSLLDTVRPIISRFGFVLYILLLAVPILIAIFALGEELGGVAPWYRMLPNVLSAIGVSLLGWLIFVEVCRRTGRYVFTGVPFQKGKPDKLFLWSLILPLLFLAAALISIPLSITAERAAKNAQLEKYRVAYEEAKQRLPIVQRELADCETNNPRTGRLVNFTCLSFTLEISDLKDKIKAYEDVEANI